MNFKRPDKCSFSLRSKLRPEIQVRFYFLCRVMVLEVGLLVLDIVSDFANGGNFILSGHPFVGGLTIVLVFLPGLVRKIIFFKNQCTSHSWKHDFAQIKKVENLSAVKMQTTSSSVFYSLPWLIADSRCHYFGLVSPREIGPFTRWIGRREIYPNRTCLHTDPCFHSSGSLLSNLANHNVS